MEYKGLFPKKSHIVFFLRMLQPPEFIQGSQISLCLQSRETVLLFSREKVFLLLIVFHVSQIFYICVTFIIREKSWPSLLKQAR